MKHFYKFFLVLTLVSGLTKAQNPYIKCYFNHPVNTTVSSGVNAHYNTSFKDTLIGYINRAKYTIDFCVYDYLYNSGDGFNAIASAVNSAYSRGVVIRWIYNGSSSNSGLPLLNSNIKTIGSPTTSAYGICHNKFVVFDANSANPTDAFVWTGSFNFSLAQNSSDYNNIIIIQDKPLAQAYYTQFNQMWGGTGASPNLANSKFGTFKSPSATNSFTVGGTPVEVYFSPKDNATTHVQNYVATANFELHFGIYTFTDNNIATAIKNRITAGVSSKGIEDQYSQSYSPYSTLSPTMGSNFKVYTGSALYHNKMMIIDALHPASDPLVGTGSYNWSASATSSNDENFIVIHDASIANQYYQSFCANFTDVGGAACAPLTTDIAAYDNGQLNSAVYPNPSIGILNVLVRSSGTEFNTEVFNAYGELLMSEAHANTNNAILNVSSLSAGCYYVRVINGADITVHKIIRSE